MKNSDLTNSQGSSDSAARQKTELSPWQLLKRKRISYLTVPLLVMATVTEFVILATGWKYQKTVCLPQGMGVTFFGIGPIGATILAVEMLKLPLAIWTASRHGFQKFFMLVVGLPLICLLTFQLVKDMAVYEMGIALTPASQMLKEALNKEVRITQLNGELATIDAKKASRDGKLAELEARKTKADADLAESLKRNEDSRHDAISLTDYQKTELSDVDTRQATIIKQFDADTAELTKSIADLRARRETELGRASKWNAEEARIDNDFKAKMEEYANKKAAYDKDKAEYDKANFVKREFMKKPVDPGVPPEREDNTILKPTLIAEMDAQIKAKEAELLTVNNQRRDRVAQVEQDAHRLREEFEGRSTTKREESDRKREELLAAHAALIAQLAADEKQIDQDYDAAARKADGIRAELEDCHKKAEGFYEARETSIQNTQVHRIATTVEIVRGLVMGQRPVSIKATAKERGDLYTDQISMVRIWVYPVLAFLVAFLPTLMVEIGFSTIFQPEEQRPAYRLGFFGRRLHWLYIRAGRQKILRAERLACEASGEIAARNRALAAAQTTSEKALAEKDVELQAAHEALGAAAAQHGEELKRIEEEHATYSKVQTDEWVAKLASMADSLNRTVLEKDALRDLQKSEVERQIQMRQNAWSERLTQMRNELDEQRAATEAERTAMMQAHHKKLMEVSEDSKTQVIQARRQAADAELAAVEATAKLTHELKEALLARDTAEAQLQQQADSFSLKLSQAREDAAREIEKAARQEKHRLDRQQLEIEKTLRQREEDFEHQLKQREQELSLDLDARLAEKEATVEQDARRREAELARQFEARALEVDARWKQEVQQREEAAQIRLKQREQQLQGQAEARLSEAQTQADQILRARESELERQLEAQSREADTRLAQELQHKEQAFQSRLKQREQELSIGFEARLAEKDNRIEQYARNREADERQIEARALEIEARWKQELQQREEVAQLKLNQREQQLLAQAEARISEAKTEAEQELRRRESELARQLEAQSREAETRLKQELQQKELAFQAKLKQREQESALGFDARLQEREARIEQDARRREAELERQLETRAIEAESHWKQEAQQREEAAQIRLKQREQQLQAQADARLTEMQTQTEQEFRRRESELKRQLEAQSREADTRLKQELQQRELTFQAKLKQREQELALRSEARETELQNRWASDLRGREEEWGLQTESRVRATETRLNLEMQQKEEAGQARARQREQELVAQLTAQAEARQTAALAQWEAESEKKARAAIEPFKVLLSRTESERDEARQTAFESTHQVQKLEKKLTEASTFLNGWRNGKNLVGASS